MSLWILIYMEFLIIVYVVMFCNVCHLYNFLSEGEGSVMYGVLYNHVCIAYVHKNKISPGHVVSRWQGRVVNPVRSSVRHHSHIWPMARCETREFNQSPERSFLPVQPCNVHLPENTSTHPLILCKCKSIPNVCPINFLPYRISSCVNL